MPPASPQQLVISQAGPVDQVFALTNSETSTISYPGHVAPIPGTTLEIDLANASLLVITYSMRVYLVQQAGTTIYGPPGPIMLVRCEFDGKSCAPNGNDQEFGNNLGWGDARSFTWVVHKAKKGAHTVAILGGLANPNNVQAYVTNRSLVVQAARLRGGLKIQTTVEGRRA